MGKVIHLVKGLVTNWGTTSAGLASILVAVADILHPANGFPDWHTDYIAIFAGLTGIFGKDFWKQ